MRKEYTAPNIVVFEIAPCSIMQSSGPNSKWTQDENGNWVNPGGNTPPGHNKHEYRNDLWQ